MALCIELPGLDMPVIGSIETLKSEADVTQLKIMGARIATIGITTEITTAAIIFSFVGYFLLLGFLLLLVCPKFTPPVVFGASWLISFKI